MQNKHKNIFPFFVSQPPWRGIWGSGLLFAFTLRPGGLGSPQIGGFCGRAAFWGVKRAISAFSTVYSPKSHIPPLTVLFTTVYSPKSHIPPLTVLFTTVYSPKSHIAPHSAFFHCVLPKKPYHPLQCFFPLFHHRITPQKAMTLLQSLILFKWLSEMSMIDAACLYDCFLWVFSAVFPWNTKQVESQVPNPHAAK